MKIIRPNVPTGSNSGGYIGAPQPREWLREWIEDKGRWVLLKCGHTEDMGDRGLLIINAFPDTTVWCVKCDKFAAVKKPLKRRTPPMKYPDTPAF